MSQTMITFVIALNQVIRNQQRLEKCKMILFFFFSVVNDAWCLISLCRRPNTEPYTVSDNKHIKNETKLLS